MELYSSLAGVFDQLEVQQLESSKSAIMVINLRGCSVCWSRALHFLKENINKTDQFSYLITGVESRKDLAIRLGKDVLDSPHLYIDHDDLVSGKGVRETSPIVFYFSKDQQLEHVEIVDIDKPHIYSNLVSEFNLLESG